MFEWIHLYLQPVLIMPAANAGNQIALEINTRLFSYSIAVKIALLIVSKLKDAMVKFCIGLFLLGRIMEVSAGWVLGKNLSLIVSSPCLNAPGVAPLDLVART